MEQSIDIMALLRGIKDRIWLIIAIFMFGSVLAAGVAYILPPVFKSTAKILVTSQSIPDELARSTVTASAGERLALIEQRLMTRANLLSIADRLDLFADRPGLSPTAKVDLLRDSTTFESFSHNSNPRYRGPTTVSAFTITYASDGPLKAARVANEFVSMVLEQNLRARSKQASETREFFGDEVQRLSGELTALEAEIARFKEENESALPDSLDFRLEELSALKSKSYENEQRILQLEDSRHSMLAEIELRRKGQAPKETLSSQERDLADLKSQLIQKRSVYTDLHPEVRGLVAQIDALEKLIVPASQVASEGDDQEVKSAASNELDFEQRQIEAIDRQIELLKSQQLAHTARASLLETSISDTPKVEMALSAFSRRYNDLHSQYEIAVRKQAEAEQGEKLELNRKAESFEVIEQARVPEKPVAPKRAVIAAGGSIVSLGLGLGLALLLQLMNKSIRTASDLERTLQIRPLAVVPLIETEGEKRRKRLRVVLIVLVSTSVIAGVLWALHQYYMPLDLLLEKYLNRTGLGGLIDMISRRIG